MDIHYIRSEFLNVKDFFFFLYSHTPRQNSSRLNNASDRELDTLIKFLHLACTGKIALKKHNFKALKKSRRLQPLRALFKRKDSYLECVNTDREKKVNILKKFVTLYPNLFYTTFNLV